MTGFGLPQEGNTGATQTNKNPRLEALIDWLQGTFPQTNVEPIFQAVSRALHNDSFMEQPFGTRFYERSFKSAFGAVIAIDPRKGGKVQNRTDAYLELSGRVLEQLSPDQLHQLFVELASLDFRPSRIDLTLDDYNKTYRPSDCFEAYSQGNVIHFRGTGNWIQSGPPDQLAGTFSLGTRGKSGGGKFLQFYDKFLQSKGERDCVRCELSLYRDFAVQAFSLLSDAPTEFWPDIIAGLIFGAVDFRDRSQSSRPDRCDQLPFWSALVGSREQIKLFRARVTKTFERAKKWIQKSVAPTLAMLCEAIQIDSGGDHLAWEEFLLAALFDGGGRLNDTHVSILRQVRQAKAQSG